MAFASIRRLIRSHQARWVLVLLLACLPAAQWAASVHAFVHLRAASTSDTERAAHLPAACDLCLVAASIGGGGAPATPVAIPLPPALPQVVATAPAPQFVWLAPAAPYRSRAPPLPHA